MGFGLGVLTYRFRSRQELVAENQLLRQQVILLRRQIAKPRLGRLDRVDLVMLAGRTKTWASAMLLVKPDTILRWHREGFRLFWRRKSRSKSREPRVPKATVELIRQMAQSNKLWGAERIRGELLKLGIRHAKSTIQKYMRAVRWRPPRGQSWTTFLRNHGHQVWACDFLQTYDVFFRPIFAFLIIEIGTRRIVHLGVTKSPTSAWTMQQLRSATPPEASPRFLVRDRDGKFGSGFDEVAAGAGIHVRVTPYKTPNANAHC
ncbi:MAG: putative transposase [Hyphomicrobiaceae bacterium]|jgi:putative transposase